MADDSANRARLSRGPASPSLLQQDLPPNTDLSDIDALLSESDSTLHSVAQDTPTQTPSSFLSVKVVNNSIFLYFISLLFYFPFLFYFYVVCFFFLFIEGINIRYIYINVRTPDSSIVLIISPTSLCFKKFVVVCTYVCTHAHV